MIAMKISMSNASTKRRKRSKYRKTILTSPTMKTKILMESSDEA